MLDETKSTLQAADDLAAGVARAPRVALKLLESSVKRHRFIVDGTLTICVLELHNGYKVVGFSAAANPQNFDAALGERFSYDDAIRKAWPLEGYLLCQRNYEAGEKQAAYDASPA